MEQHKDQKHKGDGRERRSSLRLSDLHRIVDDAVPGRTPEDGERRNAGKHSSHPHSGHEKPAKR